MNNLNKPLPLLSKSQQETTHWFAENFPQYTCQRKPIEAVNGRVISQNGLAFRFDVDDSIRTFLIAKDSDRAPPAVEQLMPMVLLKDAIEEGLIGMKDLDFALKYAQEHAWEVYLSMSIQERNMCLAKCLRYVPGEALLPNGMLNTQKVSEDQVIKAVISAQSELPTIKGDVRLAPVLLMNWGMRYFACESLGINSDRSLKAHYENCNKPS